MKLIYALLAVSFLLTGCKKTVENVVPGAHCSELGQMGYTSENAPYKCAYDKNHILRWVKQ